MAGFRGGAVATALAPATAGQLGAGAGPEQAHQAGSATPVAPTSAQTAPPTVETPQLAYRGGLRGLRGGRQLVTVAPLHPVTSVDGPWDGQELQGAPIQPNQLQEHEPPPRARSWSSFFKPNRDRPRTGYLGRLDYLTDQQDTEQTPATPSETNTIRVADPRRGIAGALARAEYDPFYEQIHSAAADPVVVTNPQASPPRRPLGVGRPAVMPHWLYMRPYGHHQLDHLTGAKGVLGAPSVSLPINTTVEAPGRNPASGMRPSLLTKPNTWRVEPGPWDQDAIDAGTVTPPNPSRKFR